MKTIRTIIWFIYFWLSLIWLSPKMLLLKKGWEQKDKAIQEEIERTVRAWAQQMLFLAGVSVDVEGEENLPVGVPCLFVSNHQSNFDVPIMLTCLDKVHPILAKAELQKLPMIRTWMKYIYCVFIDRKDLRKSAYGMKEAGKRLEEGHSMVIFPEGTRSKGPLMGEFKEGAFRIAGRRGIPIVPICIEGSYKAMEAHGFWIHPATVHVRIMKPIDTKGMSKEDAKQLAVSVSNMIAEAKSNI